MAWDYSNKTKQLFMDAVQGKPGTHLGEVADPDGVGEHGSIACGDAMRFTFKVRRHPDDPTKDVITEAKYLTFGCTSAIAASEALCNLIEAEEYSPIAALKITNGDIVEELDGLPQQKIHCSVMGAEALEAAVYNWSQRRGVDLAQHGIKLRMEGEDEGRIVCKCFNITEPYLRRKIKELKLHSINDVTNAIKAGGACMTCHHTAGGIQDVLDDVWASGEIKDEPEEASTAQTIPEPVTAPEELSPYQFSKRVEQVMDEMIRPSLKRDGGDIELVDIKERMIYVKLAGACAGCAGATITLKLSVEKTLQDEIDPSIKVISI